MRRAAFIISLFCFQTLMVYSQKKVNISGEVFQINSTEPVSYAAISIKGEPIGTVANDLGRFTFYFADSLRNDTLTISSLGFKTYSQPISQILNDSIKTFHLDTVSIPIQPVFILSKGETAEGIVNKAIKRIKKNYPTKMYYMDAFYRELCMRDDKYARLIEAAVSIQDFGYDTDLNLTKIRVNEIRKSDSHLEYDQTSIITKKLFGDYNLIVKSYNSNYLRSLQNCRYRNFLCKENITRNVFTLTGCSYIDKKLIYIISYRDTSCYSKNPKPNLYTGGDIYIQADNYAIVKLDWGTVRQTVDTYEGLFNNKYLEYILITYKEYEGRYYPDLIQTIQPVPNGWLTNQGTQFVLTTLMVNNILTKRREFSRIKDKEKEIPKEDIYEKKFPYHPEFWKNYNIVLLNPALQSVNKDLQKEKPLEEQFKNNGE